MIFQSSKLFVTTFSYLSQLFMPFSDKSRLAETCQNEQRLLETFGVTCRDSQLLVTTPLSFGTDIFRLEVTCSDYLWQRLVAICDDLQWIVVSFNEYSHGWQCLKVTYHNFPRYISIGNDLKLIVTTCSYLSRLAVDWQDMPRLLPTCHHLQYLSMSESHD